MMRNRQDTQAAVPHRKVAFLTRLAKDVRGNTLAIGAAATIPLLGMIGSGVDVSRAYLAKNRLQQACDAGVLAGRKVMIDSVDDKVRDEVRKFVNFNFPQGTLGTTAFTIDPTEGESESVDLSMSTAVPTEIIKVLNIDSFPISVSCTARQDFVNTDVMLVLDTTLSMNCLANEGKDTYCPTEKSSAKIKALRQGVVELYKSLRDPQMRLEAAGLRLRYGIVPYSMTVNTGKLLYATNNAWIRSTADYQQCQASGKNSCASVAAKSVPHDAAWLTSTWNGCIEERATVTTIRASSGYNIPAGASDLDIDTVPTSDATRWAPYDPASVTTPQTGLVSLDSTCPKESRHLQAFASESDLTTWLSTMTAGGRTYPDLGLIWGARLMSSTGLWPSTNPTTFNTFPVNKHMIFMTDGAIDPEPRAYTSYGVEEYASGGQRVTGNGTAASQDESHIQRFRMMCNKVKGMNISLWVIAFGAGAGTGLSDELKNCASSPNQAFKADDQAALNLRFKQIGESIGALRLSK